MEGFVLRKINLTSDFRLWIGVLLYAADDSMSQQADAIKHYSNTLHECISSGIRRKFVSIKKADLVQWANDKVDQSDACQEAKTYLTSHPRGTELPDPLLLKILEEYIEKLQPDEGKNTLRFTAADLSASDLPALTSKNSRSEKDKKNSDTRDRPSTSKKSKDPTRPHTPAFHPPPMSFSTKTKLRDRQIHKLKINCLDDEPVDGPDLYIVLQQFHSLSFLQLLLETNCVPIHSVTMISDLPNLPNVFDPIHLLKSLSMNVPGGRQTLYTHLSFPAQLGPKSLFDIVAFHLYALCNDEQAYEHYYTKRCPIRIPSTQVSDIDSVRNEKSVENEVLNELVNFLCVYEMKYFKSFFNAISSSEEKKSNFKSRLPLLLKHCTSEEPYYEWNRETFAKISNISPMLAEFYMDLFHFELLLQRPMESFEWLERVNEDNLLQKLEFVMDTNPNARTRIQNRGGKLLIAITSSSIGSQRRFLRPSIPMKLSFGEWYDLKISGNLELDQNDVVYDNDIELLNNLQRIYSHPGQCPSNDHGILEKPAYTTISTPYLLCSIYPNKFYASFPSNGSKLLIQLEPSSSSPEHVSKVTYTSAQGWLCYLSSRNKEKGKRKESYFYILNTMQDMLTNEIDSFANKRFLWRKIYSNGDQWVQMEKEIHFYGHDGKRGYKSTASHASNSSSTNWTWVHASGQVWKQGEPTTQYKVAKHVDYSNGQIIWCREDDVTILSNLGGEKKVTFPDGTTILTRTNGSVHTSIPDVGDLCIFHGDYLFTEALGSKIQFSQELIMIMPQDLLLFTSFQHSKIFFPEYVVDLIKGKVVPVHNARGNKAKENEETKRLTSPVTRSLDYLFVLQKSPLPSFIYYNTTQMERLQKLITRNNLITSHFVRSSVAENLESLTMIVSSTRKKQGIRQFLKFPHLSAKMRDRLKKFFNQPPTPCNEPSMIAFDPANLVAGLKTRSQNQKIEPKTTLIGDFLKSPDFRKANQRKHIPPIPFQPFLDPELKKFKFVPIPFFKSEQGQYVLSLLNKTPTTLPLSKSHSPRQPKSFDPSKFIFDLDFPKPSSPSSYFSSPKLVPKSNKAFRLRHSRNTLNESNSAFPTPPTTHY